MKIKERVEQAIKDHNAQVITEQDGAPATVEKMIFAAYFMGLEAGTKAMSEAYSAWIADMHKRAEECRYHNLAEDIIGDSGTPGGNRFIYNIHYCGEVTENIGEDPADI